MKDIDFDELDKAVTSLMGSVPDTDETVKPDDGIKTLVLTPSKPLTTDGLSGPISSTTPIAPAPTPTPAATETAPVVAPTPVPSQVSPAARRAGRFMDVVHPSSDMTKSTMGVSRHSGVIEPLSNDIVAEPATVTEPTPVVAEEPAATVESQPDLPDLSHHMASDWPDPLDMLHAAPTEPDMAPAAEIAEPASAETDLLVPAEPLSSPFLPDAKVEKRPLGGMQPDSTGDELEASVLDSDAPVSSSDPQTTPTEIILPEELQDDLMAIESRQADTAPATEHVEAQPSVSPAPVPTQSQATVAPTQLAGPTSIPQQYKAEPSTGDQTNGSIYDTDTYHKPLEHPAKKKSSAALIIWIVVLLIIGAGGGAAAYFYLLK